MNKIVRKSQKKTKSQVKNKAFMFTKSVHSPTHTAPGSLKNMRIAEAIRSVQKVESCISKILFLRIIHSRVFTF